MFKRGPGDSPRESYSAGHVRDALRRADLARTLFRFALAAAVLLYLFVFFSGGGKRLEIYRTLWQGYLFLPEQLVSDLFQMWCGGQPQDATLLDRLPILGLAGSWSVVAWATGDCMMRYLALRQSALERFCFAWGVGLQFWSLYTLVIGWAGALRHSWLWWIPGVVAVAVAVWDRRKCVTLARRLDMRQRVRSAIPWLPMIPPLMLLLLLAVLPPWEFDVREYHLQVPKEWYQQGQIGFLPHNVYGNMPMGAEMQVLAAMVLWGGPEGWWYGALTGKVLIGLYAVLGALSLAVVLEHMGRPRAGPWAAAVYLSTPWILHVSTVGLIEGAVAAYAILAATAFGRALHLLSESPGMAQSDPTMRGETSRGNRSESTRWFGLAGFLAGAAAACKYPALLFVVAPMTVLVVLQRPLQKRAVLLFLLWNLISVGPWLWKNYYYTGNPTFPLLYSLFDGRYWDEATNHRWANAHGPPRDAHGHRFHWHQLRDAIRDIGWESDKLSPLIWSLAIIGWFEPHVHRWRRFFAWLIVTYFIGWWTFTHRYDRFFIPCLAWVAVWSGLGAELPTPDRMWRRFVHVLVVAGILLNCLVVSTGALTGDNRILVPLQKLRRDEPQLLRTHPAHLYLNDHVMPGYAAVIEGDAQVFDLEIPIYYHTCWNPSWWELWTNGKTLDEQRRILAEHRVSHVFFHWSEIARYRQPGNYGFSEYITRERIYRDFVQTGLLRYVPVPSRDGWLDPQSGEIFEVIYLPQNHPQSN